MTAATTLADWLLERLAEDEAVARAATSGSGPRCGEWYWHDDGWGGWTLAAANEFAGSVVHESNVLKTDNPKEGWPPNPQDATHIARHDPARVLREVAAKRSLVLQYLAVEETATSPSAEGVRVGLRATLRALASVYAGAPGWREEWEL